MLNLYYPYFNFDKSIKYYTVLKFSSQIKRLNKYNDIKNIIKYSHIAYQIESGIFEYSVLYILYNQLEKENFKNYYNFHFNNILYNLKTNSDLVNNIIKGNTDPYMIAFLKPHELNNKKWEDITNRIQKIKNKIENVPTSDVYKCYKCGMRKITTFQVQTRGQDEDATTFVKCHNCGNIWRE